MLAPTAPSCSFRHAPDTAVLPLPHHRLHHVHNASVEACEAACCGSAWCDGFDYHRASFSCNLIAHDDADPLLSTDTISGYDHYSLQARSTNQRANPSPTFLPLVRAWCCSRVLCVADETPRL